MHRRNTSRPSVPRRRSATIARPLRQPKGTTRRLRREWGRLEPLEARRVLDVSLAPIADVTLQAGAPLHIPLNGFEAGGDILSFSVTSDNPALAMTIPEGNRSLRISVLHAPSSNPDDQAIAGDMVFELFEDLAPRTTARIIELANSGFYNGLTFHRIASFGDGSPFVIQGGDPSGDGTGGSGVQFDDEFHSQLLHTSAGILSMAKSSDDTNDSQFFVTAQGTRHLDFNHSIFGFLTAGDDIREAVQSVPVGSNDRPLSPVFMNSVTVFQDHQNGVLRLNAPLGTTGTANVTVTVEDSSGNVAQQTFAVTIEPDTVNTRPFLSSTPAFVEVTPGGSTSSTLEAFDREGNRIHFGLLSGTPEGFTVNVQPVIATPQNQTAEATYSITATDAAVGVYELDFAVAAADDPITGVGDLDVQVVPLLVTGLRLLSDAGPGNVTNLNNTAGRTLDIGVVGAEPGATIVLRSGDTTIGQGTVGADRTVSITTNVTAPLADGEHSIQAYVNQNGTLTPILQTLDITVTTAAPIFTSTPPTSVILGETYRYDARTNLHGTQGLTYSLVTRPSGMTINQQTGEITWEPTQQQHSANSAVVRATDSLGNFSEQVFSVFVHVPPTLDISGIGTTIDEGSAFEVVVGDFAADLNLPADALTFSLATGAPTGATIDPTTGLFRWTTTEADGPASVPVTFRVTDSAGLTASQTVTFTINEVNSPPVLQPIADRVIDELTRLDLQVIATDPDIPADVLTYSLGAGAPAGAQIDPQTGRFTWTPSEAQGPGFFHITVQVADGRGGVDFATFNVTVREVNHAPVLQPIADQLVLPGDRLTFTAGGIDPDIPRQDVVFSLEPGAPEGATIDPVTGEFQWQTADDQPLGVFTVGVRVTEVGGDGLFARQDVRIVVGNIFDGVFPGGAQQLLGALADPLLGLDDFVPGLLGAIPPEVPLAALEPLIDPLFNARDIPVGAPLYGEIGFPNTLIPEMSPPPPPLEPEQQQEEGEEETEETSERPRLERRVQRDAAESDAEAAQVLHVAPQHDAAAIGQHAGDDAARTARNGQDAVLESVLAGHVDLFEDELVDGNAPVPRFLPSDLDLDDDDAVRELFDIEAERLDAHHGQRDRDEEPSRGETTDGRDGVDGLLLPMLIGGAARRRGDGCEVVRRRWHIERLPAGR